MKIRSIFEPGTEIPKRFTCLGSNVSPSFVFEGIPSDAESLVLLIEDIDASPVPWTHWHVFNIPPATTLIEEGQVPAGGIEGLCNNHTFGYEGPCPKYFKGIHHYVFRLYALDTRLELSAATEPATIKELMKEHIIDFADLVGICDSGTYINDLSDEVTDAKTDE